MHILSTHNLEACCLCKGGHGPCPPPSPPRFKLPAGPKGTSPLSLPGRNCFHLCKTMPALRGEGRARAISRLLGYSVASRGVTGCSHYSLPPPPPSVPHTLHRSLSQVPYATGSTVWKLPCAARTCYRHTLYNHKHLAEVPCSSTCNSTLKDACRSTLQEHLQKHLALGMGTGLVPVQSHRSAEPLPWAGSCGCFTPQLALLVCALRSATAL